MTTYALAAAGNYHPTRINGDPILCVQHITAGLTDYIAPDLSADNTQNWGRNPASDVSWHDICDSDSAIPCLPSTATAWHAAGYNSRSIGQEIGTGGTDWTKKPAAWVEATLRNSARLWAPHVKRYGIPLVKVTKAQVDAELAKGRNAKPLGFIGHGDLDPRNRTDPGLVNGRDTFPWERLFALIRVELGTAAGADEGTQAAVGVLSPGDTGERVRILQTELNNHWLRPNGWTLLAEDGSYGPAVERVIRAFQGSAKIEVDGFCGPATQAALKSKLGVTL